MSEDIINTELALERAEQEVYQLGRKASQAHARIEEQGESLNKANQLIGRLVGVIQLRKNLDKLSRIDPRRDANEWTELSEEALTEARAYLEKGKKVG